MEIDVGGHCLTALIDTGSTHTLISSQAYHQLPQLGPLQPAPRLQALTGHEGPLEGRGCVPLGGRPIRTRLCPTLEVDMIIGADVCPHAILDFSQKLFTFYDQTYPLIVTPEVVVNTTATSSVPATDFPDLNEILQQHTAIFSPKGVPLRVLAPTIGQSKWKPGYQVLSSTEGGGLRLVELDSGRTIRLNQQDVREIPTPVSYDEVDPLPAKEARVVASLRVTDTVYPRDAVSEWDQWLTRVSSTCNHPSFAEEC